MAVFCYIPSSLPILTQTGQLAPYAPSYVSEWLPIYLT